MRPDLLIRGSRRAFAERMDGIFGAVEQQRDAGGAPRVQREIPGARDGTQVTPMGPGVPSFLSHSSKLPLDRSDSAIVEWPHATGCGNTPG